MKRPVSKGILLLVFAASSISYADENSEIDNPGLEFLEFLGSFETENGQWVDPMEIEDMLKLSNQQIEPQENSDE